MFTSKAMHQLCPYQKKGIYRAVASSYMKAKDGNTFTRKSIKNCKQHITLLPFMFIFIYKSILKKGGNGYLVSQQKTRYIIKIW